MFRETVSNADGTYFVSGIVPGVYEITAELQGFKKLGLKDIRLEIGKTSTIDLALAVGALEEVVSVSAESPLVDVTTKEVGGNITGSELVDLPSINRNFIGFIGLLPGIVPSISTESFGSDSISVNGSGPAQQQLHARRRQQQRRCHRPAGRHAGANGDRIGAGVPGHHQPVRRAVRPDDRRDHQCGHQERDERVPRQRASRSGRTPDWTAKDYFAKERNLSKPDTTARRVRRHDRRPDRQGQGALLRQPRARHDRSRRGDRDPSPSRSQLEPDRPKIACGTRW